MGGGSRATPRRGRRGGEGGYHAHYLRSRKRATVEQPFDEGIQSGDRRNTGTSTNTTANTKRVDEYQHHHEKKKISARTKKISVHAKNFSLQQKNIRARKKFFAPAKKFSPPEKKKIYFFRPPSDEVALRATCRANNDGLPT